MSTNKRRKKKTDRLGVNNITEEKFYRRMMKQTFFSSSFVAAADRHKEEGKTTSHDVRFYGKWTKHWKSIGLFFSFIFNHEYLVIISNCKISSKKKFELNEEKIRIIFFIEQKYSGMFPDMFVLERGLWLTRNTQLTRDLRKQATS